MMPTRHIVLHGHFYQPPRTDPWYEDVPRQPSASPWHDWNLRVCEECYAPNAAARLLDGDGRVRGFVNTYRHISFDFGPTLLEWMEQHVPETYDDVIEADRDSRARRGHGNAMAQAHGHLIMPLASERDRHTQVAWGIADFAARFGRDPQGLWLPETAVDIATLELVAAHGIGFTVLAPSQAARFRGDGSWQTVKGEIDGRHAYRVQLPSGRSLVAFFYDGALSRGIAFEGLLQNGERLVAALLRGFDTSSPERQLVHAATDGETYGHHHRFGEMALAHAIDSLGQRDDVALTNYASYLSTDPPMYPVEIRERTSWSCVHGVERWRSDCGCHTGGRAGWNQQWRAPLREALDELGDRLARQFEGHGGELLIDPWKARDAYIELLLGSSPGDRRAWLRRHARADLDARAGSRALAWLESQRHAMAMFTSCGWFFNDVSGIETEQVLLHAARSLQLARDCGGEDLEPMLVERLRLARSNRPDAGTAADIWTRRILPRFANRERVAASGAMLALLDAWRDDLGVYRLTRHDQAIVEGAELRATIIVRDPRDLTSGEMLVHAWQDEDRLFATARLAAGAEAAFEAHGLAGVDGSMLVDAIVVREEQEILAVQRRLLRRAVAEDGEVVLPELMQIHRAVAEADLRSLLRVSAVEPDALEQVVRQLRPRKATPVAGLLAPPTAAALRSAIGATVRDIEAGRPEAARSLLQLARLRRELAPEVDAWRAQQLVHERLGQADQAAEPWRELAALLEVRLPEG